MTPSSESGGPPLAEILPVLRRIAVRLLANRPRGDATASDVVQSTIGSYFRMERDRPTDYNSLQALLITILKRKAGKTLDKRQRSHDEQACSGPANASNAASPLDAGQTDEGAAWHSAMVNEMLGRLPTEEHRLVALLRAGNYPETEIAALLDVSERTIRNRLTEIRIYWDVYR